MVVSIGKAVTLFKAGDKVMTHLVADIAEERFPTAADILAGLGQVEQGTLQEYGVFRDNGLARMPKNLSFEQAGTLTFVRG